jgi:DNA-binding response OmpR family regulator
VFGGLGWLGRRRWRQRLALARLHLGARPARQKACVVLGRRAGGFDRSLDVHVSALRRKLGPAPSGGERIKTVRGVGYQYLRGEG